MFKATIIILSLFFVLYLFYHDNKVLLSENKALKEYKYKVETLVNSMNTGLVKDIQENTIEFNTNHLIEKYPDAFTDGGDGGDGSDGGDGGDQSKFILFDEYSKYKM